MNSSTISLLNIGKAFPAVSAKQDAFWALRNITCDVMPGEVVGIVGRNGAGKSTLLKVLGRILPPSEGTVSIRGTVASLLEVGVSFHPDFTGRENVYLSGSLFGMSRKAMDRKIEDIVRFAEINPFLDTVVKHYSSGMYMRLAFSVMSHLEPDIFLIDEALSVGDLQFRAKCVAKLKAHVQTGKTIIVSSHDLTVLQQLCTRCLWIDGGQLKQDGATTEVIAAYVASTQAVKRVD